MNGLHLASNGVHSVLFGSMYENSSEAARGFEVGDILLFREEIRGYTQVRTQEHTTPEGTGMIMTIKQPRYWEKI